MLISLFSVSVKKSLGKPRTHKSKIIKKNVKLRGGKLSTTIRSFLRSHL